MNTRSIGAAYEEKAAAFLAEQGLEILDRNFRTREGEIDIVAREGAVLVIVEVKYRSSGRYGTALEAVTRSKQRQLRHMAGVYLSERMDRGCPVRFDVIGFTEGRIRWIRGAF